MTTTTGAPHRGMNPTPKTGETMTTRAQHIADLHYRLRVLIAKTTAGAAADWLEIATHPEIDIDELGLAIANAEQVLAQAEVTDADWAAYAMLDDDGPSKAEREQDEQDAADDEADRRIAAWDRSR